MWRHGYDVFAFGAHAARGLAAEREADLPALYTEEGLQLRHKTPKRRVVAKLRDDRSPPAAPNQVRAMAFLSDQLFDGRKIRILTIVDTFSRLSPAIDVRPHYRGTDVFETLERVTAIHGTPKTIPWETGPSSTARRSIFGPGSTG